MFRINGMRIIFDTNCLEATPERMFPDSRHRSKRIKKKLLKRFGGEFKMRPAMFKIGNTILSHPAHRPHLEAALERT